jgi:Eukaryotic protein of unknown function (DUF866)
MLLGVATFSEVDLTDKEWAEYDEDNDLSVSVTALESRFDKA